jgi:hypothetical protein
VKSGRAVRGRQVSASGKAYQHEFRGEFLDTADRRYAQTVAYGKTVPWSEIRRYLERRVTGKKVAKPRPEALAR